MKHIRIACHVLSDAEKAKRFVKAHPHELIDAINEVCDVAQSFLNNGTSILIAEVRKSEESDEIVWGLQFGIGKSTEVMTKNSIISWSDFSKGTFLWSLVMERCGINGNEWNDHFYNKPLSYDDLSEINTALELIDIHADC